MFTFDKKLGGKKLDEMVGQDLKLEKLIRDLQANKGVDEDNMLTYKFFQINKSIVKTL